MRKEAEARLEAKRKYMASVNNFGETKARVLETRYRV